MAKKKKKSKFKKILKTLGKVAMLGGAGFLASKAFGGRGKGNAARYTEGDIGIGQRGPIVDDYNYVPKKVTPPVDKGIWDSPWGARGGGLAERGTGVALKKGGRVTGIAKRGFGRALMKGKK